eukprot:scaffold82099_cov67-Phaeocystis_antarctica.AAC.4
MVVAAMVATAMVAEGSGPAAVAAMGTWLTRCTFSCTCPSFACMSSGTLCHRTRPCSSPTRPGSGTAVAARAAAARAAAAKGSEAMAATKAATWAREAIWATASHT